MQVMQIVMESVMKSFKKGNFGRKFLCMALGKKFSRWRVESKQAVEIVEEGKAI